MPRLAIVIPAVGNIESLEGTLVSVLENRPADCEIVVALAGPYADPYDLKDEVSFVPPGRNTSIVAAINGALATTQAPFIHLLASGCQVSEGWTDAPLARFGNRQVGSVAPMVWEAGPGDRIFAAGVGYRAGRLYLVGHQRQQLDDEAKQAILGPCGFAGFYRKAALDMVGGFSTRLGPRQADADMAIVLACAGFSVACEPRSNIRASEAADPDSGALRQALYDERLFWRNLTGARGLLSHVGQVGLELARSFPRPRMAAQIMGRFMACLEMSSHARHRRALVELAARSIQSSPCGDHVRIDGEHQKTARFGRAHVSNR